MKPMPILKEHKDKVDLSVLEIYTEKRRKLVRDKRSFTDAEGHPHIHPLVITGKGIYIVCPYCGEIHFHTREPGDRVPHCSDFKNQQKRNYIIETWEEPIDD